MEVVKVRLQSSHSSPMAFNAPSTSGIQLTSKFTKQSIRQFSKRTQSSAAFLDAPRPGFSGFIVFQHWREIVRLEGIRGLWKGVGANVVGVAPSKAVYFWAYSHCKRVLGTELQIFKPNSPLLQMTAAAYGGFLAATAVNPIWMIKTRMQLDRSAKGMSILQCIRMIYNAEGFMGFYKGVGATYYGLSEIVVRFVVYEQLREMFISDSYSKGGRVQSSDVAGLMLIGGAAKIAGAVLTYPYEVVRTRLREQNTKYSGFWQTLYKVAREEGRPGLYRGLVVDLVRSVPNTAVTMVTYELVVLLFGKYGQ
jgi:solute carrier family 25 protein 33/36